MSLQAASSVIASGVANKLLPYLQTAPRTSHSASNIAQPLICDNQLCISFLEDDVQHIEPPTT